MIYLKIYSNIEKYLIAFKNSQSGNQYFCLESDLFSFICIFCAG